MLGVPAKLIISQEENMKTLSVTQYIWIYLQHITLMDVAIGINNAMSVVAVTGVLQDGFETTDLYRCCHSSGKAVSVPC